MADDGRDDLLILLAKLSLEMHAKILALRTLLITKEFISLEEFDRCLSDLQDAAKSATEKDLDSRILEFLQRFEGPVQ